MTDLVYAVYVRTMLASGWQAVVSRVFYVAFILLILIFVFLH